MKKIVSIITVLMVLINFSVIADVPAAQALSFRPSFKVESDAAILYNVDTHTIVYEKNADKQCSPAQTVQIMTAIIAMEKAPSLESVVEVPANFQNEFEKYRQTYPSDEYPYNEVTLAGLEEGEQMKVEHLISAMLLQSSCEAAVALAYNVGEGSVQNFVNMMNEKAKAIGAVNTHFANPHGLYDESQHTTARDMLLITEYALNLPGFAELSSNLTYSTGGTNLHSDGLFFKNYNVMMDPNSEYYFKGTKGIKTGNSKQSGRCLVSRASRDGQNYVVVLFNAPFQTNEYDESIYTHLLDATHLFDWAFRELEHKVVLEETQEVRSPKINYAKGKDYINLKPANDVKCMWLSTLDTSAIITEIDYVYDELNAPIKAGEKLGTLKLRYLENEIGTVDLVAYSDAEFSYFKYAAEVLRTYGKSTALKNALRVATGLTLVYFAFVLYLLNRRAKKRRESRIAKAKQE